MCAVEHLLLSSPPSLPVSFPISESDLLNVTDKESVRAREELRPSRLFRRDEFCFWRLTAGDGHGARLPVHRIQLEVHRARQRQRDPEDAMRISKYVVSDQVWTRPSYLMLKSTSPLGKTRTYTLLTRMEWKWPVFSLRKNVSGIHTFCGSVSVR